MAFENHVFVSFDFVLSSPELLGIWEKTCTRTSNHQTLESTPNAITSFDERLCRKKRHPKKYNCTFHIPRTVQMLKRHCVPNTITRTRTRPDCIPRHDISYWIQYNMPPKHTPPIHTIRYHMTRTIFIWDEKERTSLPAYYTWHVIMLAQTMLQQAAPRH